MVINIQLQKVKRILFGCLLLLSSATLLAGEGIDFSSGSWKEILNRAKKENKLVFIDVYTSWCGPCKMMAAQVFPQKEVGNLFNTSFINYKIDAEKGEGIDIAKKFEVRAFPTYLFVNGDGVLVYRTGGFMPAASFLNEAGIALKEKNDPHPFLEWEARYNKGERSKDFLLGYMKKRALLKLPSAELAEELFPLLSEKERMNPEIISNLVFFDARAEYVPDGKVFNYVVANYKLLDSLNILKYPLGLMENGINNYFKKNIIAGHREKMLPEMIDASRQLMEKSGATSRDIVAREKEITYEYFSGTGNEEKLIPAATDFVNNGLMKLDIAGMQSADSVGFAKFMEPYLSGKEDSAKDNAFAMMKRLKKNDKMLSASYRLRDAAEAIYKNSNNKLALSQAAEWAKKANEWFPHFSSAAVYAGLLFKTGETAKAITAMEEASKDPFLDANADLRQLLKSNAEQMSKNIAPRDLWHR